MKFLNIIPILCLLASPLHAGYFSDYAADGNFNASGGRVAFDEVTGDSSYMEAGDIVTFVVDYSSIGSTAINSTTTPQSIYGIFRLEFVSKTTTGSGPFEATVSKFKAATGAYSLSNFLNLGTSTITNSNSLTVDATSGFALISSASTDFAVSSLSKTGATYGLAGQGFNLDAVGNFSGSDFFEIKSAGDQLYYGEFDPSVSGRGVGDDAVTFKTGISFSSYSKNPTDPEFAVGTVSTTNFAGATVTTSFVTAGIAQTAVLNSDFEGSLDATTFNISTQTVPEPSSLLVLAPLAGLVWRRRRASN
jgi:hypothetical protein